MHPTKRILVIDDDCDYSEGIKTLLEANGYTVETAPDGKAGLAAARSQKPDLIVLDVMMTTETEGLEVSREIAASEDLADCPVILMTGIRRAMNLPFQFEPDTERLPVKAVLEKPVPPAKLLEAVSRII